MIPMIKCVKHGLCRANVVHVCQACEDEKKGQSNERALNQFKVEVALEVFNEWWCGYRGSSHDVADYEYWLKNKLEKENTLRETLNSVTPPDSIEERLIALESKLEGVPGTALSRIMDSQGSRWSLGVGPMAMPKRFFNGKSIEECLASAEDFFNRKE